MAHTSNKIPIRLVLLDGTQRSVRCYQVPVTGSRVTLDGTAYQVGNVEHQFPSALIFVDLAPIDNGCSLCELRDVLEEILVEVKSDIL